jgi:hypothetical protein
MINFYNYEHVEGITSFRSKGMDNLGEIVASLYQKVHGYCWELFHKDKETVNLFADTPMSEILEIIDQYRIPLAEKRLDGVELTEKEYVYLNMLDSMTDSILSGISPKPEQPIDVKLALEEAKRVRRNKIQQIAK